MRHANDSSLPEDFGEKLGGAGTEILTIKHAHKDAAYALKSNTFQGLLAIRELILFDTE